VYLVDTNVISELRKAARPSVDPKVLQWAQETPPEQMWVSAISIFELELGVLRAERKDTKQGRVLRAWLTRQVIPAFEGRIIAIDTHVAQAAARMHVPNPQPERDALIAASAIVHGLTVVTRDEKDFRPLGVNTLNPWN
jgi:toxin FitB